jgi:hypothetical protein
MIYKMKVLEKLAKINWDFVLYMTDEGYVLNVVFHSSAADYSRSFKFTNAEMSLELSFLKQLSEKIRNDYSYYKNREIFPAITSEDIS